MTVASTVTKQDYTGNGATTVFGIPFAFLTASHVKVTRTVGVTASVLSNGTDYTISGTSPTASVVLTSPLAIAATLRIERVVPLTQLINFRSQGAFPPGAVENGLDLNAMQLQQIGGSIDDLDEELA